MCIFYIGGNEYVCCQFIQNDMPSHCEYVFGGRYNHIDIYYYIQLAQENKWKLKWNVNAGKWKEIVSFFFIVAVNLREKKIKLEKKNKIKKLRNKIWNEKKNDLPWASLYGRKIISFVYDI